MKLKTVTIDGKTFAEVQDGRPLYVHDDGKEVAFDAPGTVATISRLNGEAKGHREAKEAVEAKLKAFEGVEDGEAARKALETVRNIKDGELIAAGKVEEIKAAAKKAAEEQVAAANKAHAEELATTRKERDTLQAQLYDEKIGGSFSRSKFIADKVAIPADLLQAQFGQRFKVEEGRIVAYDQAGNKIFSRVKPGDVADFDEALEVLVDAYLPIVQQAWVPFGSFVASGSAAGSHQYTASWANPGNFKPYVLAKVARQHKTTGQIVYQDFFAKYVSQYNYFSDSTFMCQLTDGNATFYVSNGGRFEDAWRLDSGQRTRASSYTTLGIRYYVFAIPTNL